jgi:hypothetical protein
MTHSQWINDLGWLRRYIATAEADVCLKDWDGGNIDGRKRDRGKTTGFLA